MMLRPRKKRMRLISHRRIMSMVLSRESPSELTKPLVLFSVTRFSKSRSTRTRAALCQPAAATLRAKYAFSLSSPSFLTSEASLHARPSRSTHSLNSPSLVVSSSNRRIGLPRDASACSLGSGLLHSWKRWWSQARFSGSNQILRGDRDA